MTENTRNAARTEYETPGLTVHGSVQDLTQGTAGQVPDSNNASQVLP